MKKSNVLKAFRRATHAIKKSVGKTKSVPKYALGDIINYIQKATNIRPDIIFDVLSHEMEFLIKVGAVKPWQ